MKNLLKILAITCLSGMICIMAVGMLLADKGPAATTEIAIDFKVSTGIRWNVGLGVFEVFNSAGVSYIASGEYIGPNGETAAGTGNNPSEGLYRKASGEETYHIMQDIIYDETSISMFSGFKGGSRYDLGDAGILDGRGFYLIGFPIVNGTSLIRQNAGIIRNINIMNPTYRRVWEERASIICLKNNGKIDSCSIYGNASNIESYGYFGGIAGSSTGTIINCHNKMDINLLGDFYGALGGIVGEVGHIFGTHGGFIFDCSNEGSLSGSLRKVGGIVGIEINPAVSSNNLNFGDIEGMWSGGIIGGGEDGSTLYGNKNFGNITGDDSACGIKGGGPYTGIIQAGCENYGELLGDGEKNNMYLGYVEPTTPGGGTTPSAATPTMISPEIPPPAADTSNYGIYYSATYNGFLITNTAGVSHIGSDRYFNAAGAMSENTQDGYFKAERTAAYYITKDIEYTDSTYIYSNWKNKRTSIEFGGIVDGQGFTLKNFPVVSCDLVGGGAGKGGYTSLFSFNSGTLRNLVLEVYRNTISLGILTYETYTFGFLCVCNDGLITGCSLKGENEETVITLESRNYTFLYFGGIVGWTYGCKRSGGSFGEFGAVVNCSVDVGIFFDGISGLEIGGVVGVVERRGVVLDCVRSGEILIDCFWSGGTGRPDLTVGGIIGATWGFAYVARCVNYGSITVNHGCYLGGVVGSVCGDPFEVEWPSDLKMGFAIWGCYNFGDLFINTPYSGFNGFAGGILGWTCGEMVLLRDCGNFGDMLVLMGPAGVGAAGGCVGFGECQLILFDVFNCGNITINGDGTLYAGGVGVASAFVTYEYGSIFNSGKIVSDSLDCEIHDWIVWM